MVDKSSARLVGTEEKIELCSSLALNVITNLTQALLDLSDLSPEVIVLSAQGSRASFSSPIYDSASWHRFAIRASRVVGGLVSQYILGDDNHEAAKWLRMVPACDWWESSSRAALAEILASAWPTFARAVRALPPEDRLPQISLHDLNISLDEELIQWGLSQPVRIRDRPAPEEKNPLAEQRAAMASTIRFRFDRPIPQAILGDETYDLTQEQALLLQEATKGSQDQPITFKAMQNRHELLSKFDRASRIKMKMPLLLRKLIRSDTRGYWIARPDLP